MIASLLGRNLVFNPYVLSSKVHAISFVLHMSLTGCKTKKKPLLIIIIIIIISSITIIFRSMSMASDVSGPWNKKSNKWPAGITSKVLEIGWEEFSQS